LVKVEVVQRLEPPEFVSATTSRGYEVAAARGHVASRFAKCRCHAERIAPSQSNWRAWRWRVVGDRQTALVPGNDVVSHGSGARASEVSAREHLDQAVVYRLHDVTQSPLAPAVVEVRQTVREFATGLLDGYFRAAPKRCSPRARRRRETEGAHCSFAVCRT